ncbi:MAG: hypothetical protein HYZ27_05430 [Deltaproteobacteria bacterium]|nr:hypothetical protein [Deltaproteobacteria bacterium]
MTEILAHALIDARLVAADAVQEALKRQVVHGGSLDTNLLEIGALAESDLLRALADAFAMPAVGKDEIDEVADHIPRLFPLVFAETYRMVPYRLVGTNLGVLVQGPADEQLLSRIHERLRLTVKPAVTTEARLHYAMHRLYGTGLLPRYRDLLIKLDGEMKPQSSDAPMLAWGVASASAPRRPGDRRPIVVSEVLGRLAAAGDRDGIVDIIIEVALSTFSFAAIFLVHGDQVRGWRGIDPESTRRVARISVPVELPSVFQTIYATHGHYLGPLPTNSVNVRLIEEMGRQPPRTALLAPVPVGGKLAGILYADNGERGVPSQRVASILLITHRAGMALESLIRRRKAASDKMLTAEPESAAPRVSDAVDLPPVIAPPVGDPEVVADTDIVSVEAPPQTERPVVGRSHYVPFADVDETPEGSVSEWEDVLVETMGSEIPDQAENRSRRRRAEQESAPAVTWEDVIAEAMAVPSLAVAAPSTPVEVAGTQLDERALLLDSLDAADPEVWKPAIEKLVPLGAAMDAEIVQRFPGRLHLDPFATQVSLPAFALCSGITALLFARGPAAAPLVLQELENNDRVRRFFAIYFLYAVPYPPALELLARRLYDAEPRNRYLAADTLRNYRHLPGYRRILQGLRDHLKVPVFEAQVATVQVLGQMRDPSAVPSLIPLVVSPRQALARAALSALTVICAQSMGKDVTRWAEWWQSHFNKPREAWLLEGMRHIDAEIRRIAAREFQLLTGQPAAGLGEPSEPSRAQA